MRRSVTTSVTIRVRCSGRLHRLTWRRGRLYLHDHTPADLTFSTLLDTPTRCRTILDAVQDGPPFHREVPTLLRRAIRAYQHTRPRARLRQEENARTFTIHPSREGLSLEARGRNGWFIPRRIHISHIHWDEQDRASISVSSTRRYHSAAPIYLCGPRADLLQLCRHIVTAITRLRPRPAPQ